MNREYKDAMGWLLVGAFLMLACAGGVVISVGMILSGFWMVSILGVLGVVGCLLVGWLMWDIVSESWRETRKAKARMKQRPVVAFDVDPHEAARVLEKRREDLVKQGGLR